jgi:hypothetical protein
MCAGLGMSAWAPSNWKLHQHPRGELPSTDFAPTGSLMRPRGTRSAQLLAPAELRPGKDRVPRYSDRSGNRLVFPSRILGKGQQEGSLLICRVRGELTARFTALPFRFLILLLLLAFFVLNNPDDLDADADVSLHQEFDAALLQVSHQRINRDRISLQINRSTNGLEQKFL